MTELDAKNAKFRAAGCADCPVCGDSLGWKTGHATEYFRGRIVFPNFTQADGSLAITCLCEDCWANLEPATRLPHYEAMLVRWTETLEERAIANHNIQRAATVNARERKKVLDPEVRQKVVQDARVQHEGDCEAIRRAVLAGG